MNSNGFHLIQLYTEFELVICEIVFKQNETHKVTWIHSRSKHRNIFDLYYFQEKWHSGCLHSTIYVQYSVQDGP